MSSPDKTEGVLHPDHPPAVKAGGMRIVQNKSHLINKKQPEGTAVPKPEEDALKVSTSPPKTAMTQVSGALKHGDADFPKEAVESFHVKPMASKDHNSASSKPVIIHQPRK